MQRAGTLFQQWTHTIAPVAQQVLALPKARPAGLCLGAAVTFFATLLLSAIILTQLPLQARLSVQAKNHVVSQPIAVELNQAVSADTTPRLTPEAPGAWQREYSVLGVQRIVFVPAGEGLTPATEYEVKLDNMKRVTGQALPEQSFLVTTESAPSIASVTPSANAKNVPADGLLTVQLSSPNRGMRQLRAEVSPKATLLPVESDDDARFSWKAEPMLQQGKTYTLKVYDDDSGNPEQPLYEGQFTIAKEPEIVARSTDFLYPDETIDVTFGTAMRTDEPGIRCECEGEGAWKNSKTYQFTPTKIEVNKAYKFTVPKGLRATDGGLRVKDKAYTVKTPGSVRASISGIGGSASTKAPITVTFDQLVKKDSAQAAFTLSPKVAGSFTWPTDKTMVFTPNGYSQQTTYTASIQAGVAPVRFGLPGSTVASMQFMTEAKTVKLDVPLYAQQHPSSCEAASLRMALAFHGVNDVDASIVRKMGYNGQYKSSGDDSTWDDPSQMYVGDIDGRQSLYQGYGAYAAPIAKAARAYGREASAHYGVGASFVARQIHDGNPVVIIGTVSHMSPIPISWKGPNGKVYAWMGMHARTVVGVVGRADNPIGFWVNDPYRGTHEYWSAQRLVNDINPIPQVAGQVVVVK